MADGDDGEDLLLERELLLAEVEALRGEVEYLLALSGREPLADHIARRRFLTRLEDEICRSARHETARFTVIAIDVDGGAPKTLVPHVRRVVRKGDLLVRASRSMFLVLLHDAGPLGRKRFEDRLFRALQMHETETTTTLSVRVGAALYPRDGQTAVELIQRTQQGRGFASSVPPVDPRRAQGVVQLVPPRGPPGTAERALKESLTAAVQGEVVVRGLDGIGRVYVDGGKVAWAHCSSASSPGARSLTEAIVRAQGASLRDVRDAFVSCRASGQNIAEHLIQQGIVSRDTMRAILGRHIQAHLIGVITLESPEVLFLPQSRSYGSDLLFSAEELFGEDEG
jgi:GGDEF domain-containing protein